MQFAPLATYDALTGSLVRLDDDPDLDGCDALAIGVDESVTALCSVLARPTLARYTESGGRSWRVPSAGANAIPMAVVTDGDGNSIVVGC